RPGLDVVATWAKTSAARTMHSKNRNIPFRFDIGKSILLRSLTPSAPADHHPTLPAQSGMDREPRRQAFAGPGPDTDRQDTAPAFRKRSAQDSARRRESQYRVPTSHPPV